MDEIRPSISFDRAPERLSVIAPPTHRSQRPFYFDAPELRNLDQLLDVGGGPGFVASLLKEENPRIKITVFDLPAICETALNIFRESDQSADLGAHPGDFFHDPFPSGFKAMQLSHVLELLSADRACQLLKKTFDALPKTGRLLVYGLAPLGDNDNYLQWLRSVGFTRVRCRRDAADKIFLVAIK